MTKMMWRSIAALMIAATLFVAVTFAWFATSFQVAQDNILLDFNPTDFEFSLYRFRDPSFDGRNEELLFDNICVDTEDAYCFEPHRESDLFWNPYGFRPGQKVSFAMTVTNIGAPKAFDLVLYDVSSFGSILSGNAVQRAFQFRVERLVYWNGNVEDATLIDVPTLTYAGKNPMDEIHFSLIENTEYTLAGEVPLGDQNVDKTAIVYFHLYFDPEITAIDNFGMPTSNSNAFQNQILRVEGLRLRRSSGGV